MSNFRFLTTGELIKELDKYKFKQLHVHHTWKPAHSSFKGNNHVAMQQSMKDFHTKSNGWSDIGQHLTLFPDGAWLTGRPFNISPASISGWNTGALAVEMIGNFDIPGTSVKNDLGYDLLQGRQKEEILKLIKYFLDKYGESSIKFHREGPGAGKTCPGTSLDKNKLIQEAKAIGDKKEVEKLYRVQVGAYKVKANAEKLLEDLKKLGFNGYIKEEEINVEIIKQKEDYREYETDKLYIQEVIPSLCYVAFASGKNLKQLDVIGINGTWQNNKEAHLTRSIWGLLANQYGKIGENSYQNSPNGHKRGTIVYYQDGELDIVRVNNINEFKKPILWAIGGGSLIPDIVQEENFASDIFRYTYHTAVGIKDGRVYQIVSKIHCTMSKFQEYVKGLGLEKAIFLDGGGSSQMNTVTGKGLYSSRGLASGLFIKGVK